MEFKKWDKTKESKLNKTVKDRFLKSVPKYYYHTLKVVNNMKNILRKNDIGFRGKPEILIPAAYLHDIGYSAKYNNDFAGNIENQEIKIKIHSSEGEKIAKEILKEINYDDEYSKDVVYLVSVHHREDIPNKNLKFLLEADKVF